MTAPTITYPVVRPFGNPAVNPTDPGGATLPIPLDTQIAVLVGAASFEDGFPAATMVDPETDGGVNPYGQDMDGILYMITQYCALMQAGLLVHYNADASTFFGGYAIGAKLASTTPGRTWTNVLDGNVNDPDSVSTGWRSNNALHVTIAPTTGQHDNFVLPGASDFALDVDTTAGPIDFSGFVAQCDGQTLYLSNVIGASLMQILASNGGSGAANQIRSATDLGLIQNQTFTIKYFAGLNRWLAI